MIHSGKVLIPVPKRQWMPSSQAQTKDTCGNENRTEFRITAYLNDGHIGWQGTFLDRGDADAFLYSAITGAIHQEPQLWRLPMPAWEPYLDGEFTYQFSTTVFLSSSPGSLLTYSRPADWNNSSNTIDCIGAGGGGGKKGSGNPPGAGGAGGGYAQSTNVTLGATASYQIGAAGQGKSGGSGSGTIGGDTWFNASTFAASSVAAKGGPPGDTNGGAAVAYTSNIGNSIRHAGGDGGDGPASFGNGGGGGGAGGPNGDGVNSTGAGGQAGDAGFGGAATGGANIAGNPGAEWGSAGSGGGGGGGNSSPTSGKNGGAYGGGGGGNGTSSGFAGNNGGDGAQGIIRVLYDAFIAPTPIVGGNMPMLGM